jgi:hypothetical protein
MIPPDAQRAMSKRADYTVVELEGSHAIYVSQPGGVAELIETATGTVKAAGRCTAAGTSVQKELAP